MLHDRTDVDIFTVTDGIDIQLDGIVKELVNEYRSIMGDRNGFIHVLLEFII